jgi:hypothetical protein
MENKQQIENTKIWDSNFDVAPEFTKRVTVNGRQPFTNIDTYYLLQQATKEFGSYGKGFGLSSLEWSEKEFKDGTILMYLDAVFFYNGAEFPIRNSLKYVYNTKGGYLKIDEDAPKKLLTNTIAKSLSYIGFGASVYMGKFDDFAYVDELSKELTLISTKQRQEITKLIDEAKVDLIKFNESFSISKLTDLKESDFNKAIAMLQAKLRKIKKDESRS